MRAKPRKRSCRICAAEASRSEQASQQTPQPNPHSADIDRGIQRKRCARCPGEFAAILSRACPAAHRVLLAVPARQEPDPEGADAAQAFQHTVALAQSAERLGYRRYWLAEHHGNRNYAGSAPEVLASHVLAKTSRIRVGTGGVMLQHYSPFKVAETFRVLASLAPGRVDLGIGKAPGGLPLTSKALQWLHDPLKQRSEDFGVRLAELDAFLHDGMASGHALAGAVATPNPPQLPQRVLLGGSPESAVLAARLGWQFVYAGTSTATR
jgi:luciferase family oxidoreductase group 1